MTTAANTSGWLHDFQAGLDRFSGNSLDGIPGHLRQNAINALREEALPVRNMERWRYTPVDKLFELPLSLGTSESANDEDLSGLFTPGVDAYQFVVTNGTVSYLGDQSELPEGVVLQSLHQALSKHHELVTQYIGKAINHQPVQNALQTPASGKDSKLFEYLNQSASPDGLFIYIPENLKLLKPVEVVFLKSGSQAELVQTHSLVVVSKNAEMTLVEKHVGDMPSNSFSNNQMELVIDSRATMKHYYLQQQASDSWHRNNVRRIQDSDSHYSAWFGCCGSHWSRLEIDTYFTGENATSEIQGIQLASNGQVNDVHLDIRHDLPGCQSEQHFRGLVSGKSKVVFDGNITVSQDAQKTVAHLSDNNLMLTRSAEVDAKPQLEIYADDVQCSHGTSIGELDERQIFYLRSRGIPEEQARSMLSIGFVAELIENIELEPFRELMIDVLKVQLEDSSPGGN